MSDLGTCLRSTKHLSIYKFLIDSYVAIAVLNDRHWADEKLFGTNFHDMLKCIRDEVIKLMKFLADKDAGIKKGDIMDLDGSFPVSISNVNVPTLLECCSLQLLAPNLMLPRRRPDLMSATWIRSRFLASNTTFNVQCSRSGRTNSWGRSRSKIPSPIPLIKVFQEYFKIRPC
jgi:hypothetical protein